MEQDTRNLLEDFVRWAETAPREEIIANLEATNFRDFLETEDPFEDTFTVQGSMDVRAIEFYGKEANTYSYGLAA
jgi:hypothetical protein